MNRYYKVKLYFHSFLIVFSLGLIVPLSILSGICVLILNTIEESLNRICDWVGTDDEVK